MTTTQTFTGGRLSVYHVTATASDEDGERSTFVIGVCATGKSEAHSIAACRLLNDGYSNVKSMTCERVAPQGTWQAGTAMIYTSEVRS